jgi:hypothetical protein
MLGDDNKKRIPDPNNLKSYYDDTFYVVSE